MSFEAAEARHDDCRKQKKALTADTANAGERSGESAYRPDL
jgi:hypothetical protein